MIEFIELEGFKRFAKKRFAMAPLTVLAGLNGSGKTSLIHALLLLREAACARNETAVQLNGPYGLELGTVEDVLNWNCSNLSLSVGDSRSTLTYCFDWPSEDAMHMRLIDAPVYDCVAFSSTAGAFTYLSAERLGPRSSHKASSLPIGQMEVGVWGENCAQILEARGNRPVDPNRLRPESQNPSFLKYEVERWLSEIARPVEIDAERYPGSTVYALKFRSPGDGWVRATNMGFGVSYALPIVVGGLTARTDGLFVVENPEAHLHPQGQSRMGGFLAWLASKGVQVVVETHSDHVINGIRRAIGEYRYLEPSKAIVHFFETDKEPLVQQLQFNERGSVSHWPKGFFDQYQIDVAALGQIRRRRG